mmetsp:Transcript_119329/g.178276  ORF Transcript_119329/g.178276 Transcript_119329/m.178276 type:complete len:105 (+) Transcript_119329:981-1295(+)
MLHLGKEAFGTELALGVEDSGAGTHVDGVCVCGWLRYSLGVLEQAVTGRGVDEKKREKELRMMMMATPRKQRRCQVVVIPYRHRHKRETERVDGLVCRAEYSYL